MTGQADSHAQDDLVASMQAQLDELYGDRERLTDALGSLTTDDLLVLIESMRTQLDVLYAERDQSESGDLLSPASSPERQPGQTIDLR